MTNWMAPRAATTLRALCETLVPGAPDDLAGRVAERALRLPPAARASLERALVLLDTRGGSAALGGRGRPFAALAPDARAAWLRRMERSRLPFRRAACQALRRLVLYTAWTGSPAGPEGWPAPLDAGRAPHPWEGPLPGPDRPEEAVLRVPDPGRWRAPPPAPNPGRTGIASARSLADGSVLRADVCVIGSGAGGSVAACRFAEAGRSVVVLEEGPFLTEADFPVVEAEATDALYADGGLRTTHDHAIALLQGRCVGGGTTVNWLLVLRPRPWAMHEWQRTHGAELLGGGLLVPELERVEAELGVGTVPDDAHNAQNRILLDGAARLGWRVECPRISARGCIRAGTCGLGCRHGARRGATSVWLPRALAASARILADARAERIERIEAGGASALKRVTVTVPGGRIAVEAPTVIVAAGAVGTPALLRRSGLGNANVGRYLRLHPTTATFARFDRDIVGGTGIPQSAVCTEFHDVENGWGHWIECPPIYPGLAAASIQGFGASHRDTVVDYRRLAALIVLVRDGRDTASMGDVSVGRDGHPRIRYRLGPRERHHLARGLEAAARIQLAAGARDVRTLHVDGGIATDDAGAAAFARLPIARHRMTVFSAHVNGTCRMGGDARRHACDPEGRLRGAPGILVADGSLFPTAPGVNPQIAITALASLIASRSL